MLHNAETKVRADSVINISTRGSADGEVRDKKHGIYELDYTGITCTRCGSHSVVKHGFRYNRFGKKSQKFLCYSCRHTFAWNPSLPLKGRIIQTAVTLHFLGKSLRNIQELVRTDFNFEITHSGILNWIVYFKKMMQKYLKETRLAESGLPFLDSMPLEELFAVLPNHIKEKFAMQIADPWSSHYKIAIDCTSKSDADRIISAINVLRMEQLTIPRRDRDIRKKQNMAQKQIPNTAQKKIPLEDVAKTMSTAKTEALITINDVKWLADKLALLEALAPSASVEFTDAGLIIAAHDKVASARIVIQANKAIYYKIRKSANLHVLLKEFIMSLNSIREQRYCILWSENRMLHTKTSLGTFTLNAIDEARSKELRKHGKRFGDNKRADCTVVLPGRLLINVIRTASMNGRYISFGVPSGNGRGGRRSIALTSRSPFGTFQRELSEELINITLRKKGSFFSFYDGTHLGRLSRILMDLKQPVEVTFGKTLPLSLRFAHEGDDISLQYILEPVKQ